MDEQFGAAILRDAKAEGFTTACCTEKSGQEEFDFEYGEDFAAHIEAFGPTFGKVLVRYNPEGDRAMNQVQAARLRRLSDYLAGKGDSRFLFELLVPAEQAQLDRLKGDKKAYDLELRPRLMVEAIQELQAAGVEPDLWKVEGLDRREDCQDIVTAARAGGRDAVSCIILGRGEDDRRSGNGWRRRRACRASSDLPSAAPISGTRWSAGGPEKLTREAAVAEIARRYREFVDIFEKGGRRRRQRRTLASA